LEWQITLLLVDTVVSSFFLSCECKEMQFDSYAVTLNNLSGNDLHKVWGLFKECLAMENICYFVCLR
jgi:hypothetical protein